MLNRLDHAIVGGLVFVLAVITADHGNAEVMRDADGRPVTAHSLNPVPIVAIGRAVAGRSLHDGVLADVAPTICELGGLARWPGMTGVSLLDAGRVPVVGGPAGTGAEGPS